MRISNTLLGTATALGLGLSIPAFASPVNLVDTTPGGVTVDGVISPGEFGDGAFVNPGNGGAGFFEGLVGDGNLFLDSDDSNLFLGVEFNGLTPNNDDVLVIYLDTGAPGANSTVGLSAFDDRAEGAITGTLFQGDPSSLTSSANVGFAEGFEFSHAVVFQFGDNGFNGLYSVNEAGDGVEFIDGSFSDGFSFNNIIQSFSTDADVDELGTVLNPDIDEIRELVIPFSALGIEGGDTLGFVGTVTNGLFPFLAAEGIGFTDSGISGNGGEEDIVLQLSDFSTFTTVPEPTSLVLAGAGLALVAGRRRRQA